MDYHEMMELGDELDQQFDELVKNCMISGAIDQGLYQKYDVNLLLWNFCATGP